MSTKVVVPPAAAARVAVAKPSHSVRPGSFRWTWVSTTPGSTASSPTSSSAAPAGTSAHGATAAMRPPATWIAAGATCPPATTRRDRITRSMRVT